MDKRIPFATALPTAFDDTLSLAEKINKLRHALNVVVKQNNSIYELVIEHGGIPGIQGEQGIQGIQGEQGIQGIQGEKGEKGDKGDQGEKGEKGDTVFNGEKGDKGDPGPNLINENTDTEFPNDTILANQDNKVIAIPIAQLEGTVKSVNGLSPDENKNVQLFEEVYPIEMQQMKANPALMEYGKFYIVINNFEQVVGFNVAIFNAQRYTVESFNAMQFNVELFDTILLQQVEG